jgi:hypothetical protein
MSAVPRVPKQYRHPLSTELTRYRNEIALRLDGWNSNILTTNAIEINVKLLQNKLLATYEAPWPLQSMVRILHIGVPILLNFTKWRDGP